ncbi:MAG: pyridoxal-phosphate dependent enzyme, partial [Ruminiclostridium sp.]|nr:pyridoxal-phosphate dependent enzyme [Ruminiclostridium sp.]
MVYQNVLEALGNTPLVKLSRMVPEGSADVLVKYEAVNIGGSIKTRTAYNMILDAERRGILTPDTIIAEPTSG